MASRQLVSIEGRPETLRVDPERACVLVVDMQNDFGSPGGLFDRAGLDISGNRAVVSPTTRVLQTARRAGMAVVYLKMGFAPDLSDLGPPGAPNRERHLHFGVGQTVDAPDGSTSRSLVRDTWGTDIVAELEPEPGDTVIYKHRFSGFFETDLDARLRRLDAKDLIVTGWTTSVCVESTIRDAMFRDYRCLLLEDCCAEPIGAGFSRTNHEASLLVIEALFGWVSTSAAFIEAFEPVGAAAQQP
jgi:ureidoacrylate peracid hydrolase